LNSASLTESEQQELGSRLKFAVDAAREASELILSHFQSVDLRVDLKKDASPVTIADRGAEELLRRKIVDLFPRDGILGEEFGEQPAQNGFRWILDPIDGTKSFVHGVPLFGTLIGIELDGRMAGGVCRMPGLDEVVYAGRGTGCWWQQGDRAPRQARVSQVSEFSQAMFCFTEYEGYLATGRGEVFPRLVESARITRGWGDCYGHILVATGRADVMVDPRMSPWDAAALVPLVIEAGGSFFDWTGEETINGGCGCSTNGLLREQTLKLLAR